MDLLKCSDPLRKDLYIPCEGIHMMVTYLSQVLYENMTEALASRSL